MDRRGPEEGGEGRHVAQDVHPHGPAGAAAPVQLGRTVMSTEIGRLMEPAARALLGKPNTNLSTKDCLRFGSHGSIAVNLEDGTYYDHENGVGGGVLHLVE